MDIEQNIVEINKNMGEMNGKMDALIKVMPNKSTVDSNTLRSKFNRKLIVLIISASLGGTAAYSFLPSGAKGNNEAPKNNTSRP